MTEKKLEVVLKVIAGDASELVRTFAWGSATEPLSIGSEGEWRVDAPGVEPVHLFVAFDGTKLFAATATAGARLLVRGVDFEQRWQVVPLPSELRFGAACITVVCDEAGSKAYEQTISTDADRPRPGPLRTQILGRPDAPATPAPQPEPAPDVVTGRGDTQALPEVRRPTTQPVAVSGFSPVQPIQRVPFGERTLLERPPAPPEPQVQATLPLAPQPTLSTGAPRPEGFGTTPAMPQSPLPALPQLTPSAQATPAAFPQEFGTATAPIVPAGHAAPVRSEAPLPAAPLVSGEPQRLPEEFGPTTLFDGGALREHAARVAQGSTGSSASAYVAEVRKVVGGSPPPPAPPVHAPEGERAALHAPAANAGAAELPNVANVANAAPTRTSALVASWRAASLPKKLTAALLPFGLVGALLMPNDPEPAPPPPQRAQAHSAGSAHVASAVAANTASAGAPAASGAAAPLASAGTPTLGVGAASSAVSAPSAASSAPTIAFVPTPAAASAVAAPSAASSAPPVNSASPVQEPLTLLATAPRDAFNAAVQGRTAEAAALYEKLAQTGSDGRIYALAARLAREDALQKPAISH